MQGNKYKRREQHDHVANNLVYKATKQAHVYIDDKFSEAVLLRKVVLQCRTRFMFISREQEKTVTYTVGMTAR